MKAIDEYIIEKQDIKRYADIIVVNGKNEILVLQRANYMGLFRGKWGFPGGSIDEKDNDSKEAALRELREETSIQLSNEEKAKVKSFYIEEHMPDSQASISSTTEYFLTELDRTPEVKISREHQRYKWVNSDTYKEKQGKYVPDIYEIIEKYFKDH